MRQFLNITRALSDEGRVRLLLALRGGEQCVCRLIDLLGLSPSTVSKHISILEQAELIECRKDGRWHYYRLPAAETAPEPVRATLQWLDSMVGSSPIAKSDRARLKALAREAKEKISACCYRK